MKTRLSFIGALMRCGPSWAAETAPKLADGHSWKSSSKDERLACLVGVSELLMDVACEASPARRAP